MLNPDTGLSASSVVISGYGSELVTATQRSGRMLAVRRTLSVTDPLVEIHPGDAATRVIGPTGIIWWNTGLEQHPVTGVLYGVDDSMLYELDEATGLATIIAPITSAAMSVCGQGLAIDAQGRAFTT
jgi:hypothetical protein